MSFITIARSRRSIRAYRPEMIPDDLLMQVLEGARVAPSACNKQPWHFIVVRDAARREAFQEAYPRSWLWSAPVIIVACADHDLSWKRRQDGKDHGDIDVSIAVDHLTLAAHDAGLGTCWVCAFDPVATRRLLGLPPHMEPLAMTPLGFPAEPGRPMERKPLADIVHWEHWQGARP
jgi:nitroreductase